jgi:hypothetical protein
MDLRIKSDFSLERNNVLTFIMEFKHVLFEMLSEF